MAIISSVVFCFLRAAVESSAVSSELERFCMLTALKMGAAPAPAPPPPVAPLPPTVALPLPAATTTAVAEVAGFAFSAPPSDVVTFDIFITKNTHKWGKTLNADSPPDLGMRSRSRSRRCGMARGRWLASHCLLACLLHSVRQRITCTFCFSCMGDRKFIFYAEAVYPTLFWLVELKIHEKNTAEKYKIQSCTADNIGYQFIEFDGCGNSSSTWCSICTHSWYIILNVVLIVF